MNNLNYFRIIQKRAALILGFIFLSLFVGLMVTVLSPREFRSTASILVVQKQSLKTDPYLADRSLERFSETLAQVIRTSAFFGDVMSGNFGIADTFPKDEQKRREAWKNKIETQVVPQSGLLIVTVYDKNRMQAEQIVKAIASILSSEAADKYHGASETILIRTVDAPLTSNRTVRPNIFLNLIASMIVGVIGSLFLAVLMENIRMSNPLGAKKSMQGQRLQPAAAPVYQQRPAPRVPPVQQNPAGPMPIPQRVKQPSSFQVPINSQTQHSQTQIPVWKKRDSERVITIFDHIKNIKDANKHLSYGGQVPLE